MKKLFNNSTKGNDTQNQTSKSKRKFLKTFSFTSLALLMGIVGTFAFAPLGISSAQEQPTTTTGLGLDPKNDPVVYTTESGLEIRMSNASQYSGTSTFTTNMNVSLTQDLTNFYYFTMGTFSGSIHTAAGGSTTASYSVSNAPINWIILGLGSHSNDFVESISDYLFSAIKNNSYLFSNTENYFNNEYETDSPAGQLIDNTISTKTYLMAKVKDSIKIHTDIPKGCMLVLSEKLLGNMYFNSTGAINSTSWAGTQHYVITSRNSYGNRYRYLGSKTNAPGSQTWNTSSNAGGSLYNHLNSLFSKNNSTGAVLKNALGFTQAQADLIVPQQLYTYYYNGGHAQETPLTDGGTYYTMFPLAYKSVYSSTYQNFCVEDYLTTLSQRTTSYINSTQLASWWYRSGRNVSDAERSCSQACSETITHATVTCSIGVRPAMVMKLQ